MRISSVPGFHGVGITTTSALNGVPASGIG